MRELQKIQIKNLIKLLILLFIVIGSIAPVKAVGNNTLKIIKYKNQVKHILTEGIKNDNADIEYKSGAQFMIWKLSETEAQYPDQSILANLKNNSITELDSKFGKAIITNKTDDNGMVEITNLEDGTYYGREITFINNVYQEVIEDVPFVITLPYKGSNELKIYPKSGLDYELRLIKYQDTERKGNELSGVGFTLERKIADDKFEVVKLKLDKEKGTYIPVNEGEDPILYTDSFGEIRVTNLPEGEYRFHEVKALDGFEIVNEYSDIVDVKKDSSTTVTMINKRPPNGGMRFRKVDENGEPLKGAKFKVQRLIEDVFGNKVFDDILENGKVMIRTSDEDGWFIFDNLPYGNYRLYETQVPVYNEDGYIISYKSIDKPIEFDINQNSLSKGEVIKVVNKRRPPDVPPEGPPPSIPPKPPFEIPNTGDISLILSALFGLVLVITGTIVYKYKDKK